MPNTSKTGRERLTFQGVTKCSYLNPSLVLPYFPCMSVVIQVPFALINGQMIPEALLQSHVLLAAAFSLTSQSVAYIKLSPLKHSFLNNPSILVILSMAISLGVALS